MSDMEKNQFNCESYADDDQEFSERDQENPSPQVGQPPKKKKGFFKVMFGGIKNALGGGGDKNRNRKPEEELALQPKAQQSQGVPQSPKSQHQKHKVA